MMAGKRVNHIDDHVGTRIRMRRLQLGLSQEKIADALGVTFQQVQKYEKGANSVRAGRLVQMATALKVPITFFFEGIEAAGTSPNIAIDDNVPAFLANRRGIALVDAFMRIGSSEKRSALLAVAEALAEPAIATDTKAV